MDMTALDVEVLTVNVQVGSVVNKGDVLAEVGADKADVEIATDTRGVVRDVLVTVGDIVPVGAVMFRLEPA